MRRLFALDQNFPEPIVFAMASYIECAELVPVRLIHPELTRVDDWQLLQALKDDVRSWDGLITSDSSMLNLEREMCVLLRTRLTLVVARGQGDNPIRATGIILAHIDHICHHSTPMEPQVWDLGVTQKPFVKPWELLGRIAQRRGTTAKEIYSSHHHGG